MSSATLVRSAAAFVAACWRRTRRRRPRGRRSRHGRSARGRRATVRCGGARPADPPHGGGQVVASGAGGAFGVGERGQSRPQQRHCVWSRLHGPGEIGTHVPGDRGASGRVARRCRRPRGPHARHAIHTLRPWLADRVETRTETALPHRRDGGEDELADPVGVRCGGGRAPSRRGCRGRARARPHRAAGPTRRSRLKWVGAHLRRIRGEAGTEDCCGARGAEGPPGRRSPRHARPARWRSWAARWWRPRSARRRRTRGRRPGAGGRSARLGAGGRARCGAWAPRRPWSSPSMTCRVRPCPAGRPAPVPCRLDGEPVAVLAIERGEGALSPPAEVVPGTGSRRCARSARPTPSAIVVAAEVGALLCSTRLHPRAVSGQPTTARAARSAAVLLDRLGAVAPPATSKGQAGAAAGGGEPGGAGRAADGGRIGLCPPLRWSRLAAAYRRSSGRRSTTACSRWAMTWLRGLHPLLASVVLAGSELRRAPGGVHARPPAADQHAGRATWPSRRLVPTYRGRRA